MSEIKGIGVPFQFTERGYPEAVVDEALLSDSIFTILSTIPGERVHRPTFGCYLRNFVFDNLTNAMAIRARAEVFRALREFEPRITVESVTFRLDKERTTLELTVSWSASGLASNETIVELAI